MAPYAQCHGPFPQPKASTPWYRSNGWPTPAGHKIMFTKSPYEGENSQIDNDLVLEHLQE